MVQPISRYEANRRGIKPHAPPPKDLMPDQGFAYNPAVAFRRLQKTTWAEDLRDIGPGSCEEVSFVERVFRRGV